MKTLKLTIATIALVLGFQAANAQVNIGVSIGTPPPRQVVVVNRPVVVHRAPVVYQRPVVVRHRPVIVHRRGPVRYRQVVHYRHGNRYYVNQPYYVAYRR